MFHAMGDEVAFLLFTLVKGRAPLTPEQQLMTIEMIHMSFEKREVITNGADRKPNAALRLLNMWERTAVDQKVKERIATEKNFLLSMPEFVPGTMPIPGPPPPPGTTPFN
jgi:hypothetical protein